MILLYHSFSLPVKNPHRLLAIFNSFHDKITIRPYAVEVPIGKPDIHKNKNKTPESNNPDVYSFPNASRKSLFSYHRRLKYRNHTQ